MHKTRRDTAGLSGNLHRTDEHIEFHKLIDLSLGEPEQLGRQFIIYVLY